MRNWEIDRRCFFTSSALGCAAVLATGPDAHAQVPQVSAHPPKFRFCLNTSTINGSQVPLREQIKIASAAGYDSVEIWLRDVDTYEKGGGDLKSLRKEMEDLGLGVDSAIAFGKWIVDDDKERAAGLDTCKRDMERVRTLGGSRIAAPPSGATDIGPNGKKIDLDAAAARYAALLEVGRSQEVIPQVELWGFSKNLSKLAEVLYVAAAANDADACVLLDVYHLYKGGSNFGNVGLVPGAKMHCLHMNDYPNSPPRETIGDRDRVYPGDGVAPLDHVLRTLARGGFAGVLSLELFNRTYWEQDPRLVAKTGLEKMKAAVAAAFRST